MIPTYHMVLFLDDAACSLYALISESSQVKDLKFDIVPSVYDASIQIMTNDFLMQSTSTEYNDLKKAPKTGIDQTDDIDNIDQLSTISSDTLSTQRNLELTLKELEQVKQNQAIIDELSVLENDTKVKALEEYIVDLNKKHSIELKNAIDNYHNIESSLRKIMEDELANCRSEELVRSANIMSKYKAEQNKSKLLKARLEEVEANYDIMSQQFAETNKKTLQIEQELIQLKYK